MWDNAAQPNQCRGLNEQGPSLALRGAVEGNMEHVGGETQAAPQQGATTARIPLNL